MIKKAISVLSAALIAVGASAQLDGNGFYRLQNYGSGRYVYLTDDKGSINASATTADYYAIVLWSGYDKALSDPATIMQITHKPAESKYAYDIAAQGTSLHKIIGYSVRIMSSGTHYKAYGTVSGVTKYLSDGEFSDFDPSYLSDRANAGNNGLWDIWPVKSDDASTCFGVLPTINAAGKWYSPFYASFPFTPAAASTKVWYVEEIAGDVAIVAEAAAGVPGATAVFIECVSENPLDNRLEIGKAAATTLPANIMKGVYFNNSSRTHYNRTPYDKDTMRVLGTAADGSLAFVTSPALDFLPANQSYLPVPAGTPAELRVMTREEYIAGIGSIEADNAAGPFDVYTLSGVKVRSQVTSCEGLPAGVYVAGGKKIRVK